MGLEKFILVMLPNTKEESKMKLKSFNKVNVETKCEYHVFDGAEWVDTFEVDYLADKLTGLTKLNKYIEMGATVRFVTVNTATKLLSITIDIKQK